MRSLRGDAQPAAPNTRRWRTLALLSTIIVAVGISAVPPAALGDTPPTGVLVDSDGPARFWEGTVSDTGPTIPDIAECSEVNCDHIRVKVKLPPNVWDRPGGLQLALRWGVPTEGSLGLFVYKDGTLVAESAAIVGIAQSVIIPSASNGTYHVYVSYGATFGAVDPDPVIDYEGLAEVEYEPNVEPLRDMLPDLAALPQDNVTYDNPGAIFDDVAQPGQSCFDSERLEQGAVQCLRYDQVMQNGGEGPLELRFDREIGVIQDEDAAQRVYRSDGSFRDIPAGQVEFHGVHSHYHFEAFGVSELWLLDAAGQLVGDGPVAVGDKISFCIADTDLIDFGLKGDAPLTYPAPDCLEPKEVIGNTEYFSYGLSNGWADRYNWYLPDQMIDTAGLADGTYVLFTTVDPENKLAEADETNNCASVVLELTDLDTPEPHANLLGTGPACP